jgi:hypothetical protein
MLSSLRKDLANRHQLLPGGFMRAVADGRLAHNTQSVTNVPAQYI